MRNIPELRGLQRRARFLAHELYVVEQQIMADRSNAQGITYTLNYKEELEEELTDLEWVLRYVNRQRNGYHLSPSQWVLFCGVTAIAASLAWLLARGGW